MVGKVQIIFSNAVFSPFSSGIFKKRIFIPYSLKNKVYSAEVIIKHEFIHIRKHHILWTYAEYFLSCIFWYNPFIHMLRKSGDFIREILCDTEIVKKISHLQYGKCLLQAAEERDVHSRRFAIAAGWFDRNQLKRRLECLFEKNERKAPFFIKGIAVMVFLLCMILLFSVGLLC